MIEKIENLYDAIDTQTYISKIRILSLNIELSKEEFLLLVSEIRASLNNYMFLSREEIEDLFKVKEHTFKIRNGRKLIITLKED